MTGRRLSVQNLIFVGFTLFSMFFGAGNLIFPPVLASQAGTLTWPAMAGFFVSAVGLPVMGVAAAALAGGLQGLAERAGNGFAAVFTLLIYLAIGPCLAIPRTAGVSFEMTVLPFLNGLGISSGGREAAAISPLLFAALRLGYSAVFFGAAALAAMRPEKLTVRRGKILCPILLVLIAVLFVGCLIWPMGGYQEPGEKYAGMKRISAAAAGFLYGYQTMDAIAALNFGAVIALNIQERGVKQDDFVMRETIKAGLTAGALMAAVYGCLAHIGALVKTPYGKGVNGAGILTLAAEELFGTAGLVILGGIFLIACLNTCIGLLSCCSAYFADRFPRLGYCSWLGLFALVSMAISLGGLDLVLRVSLPVLEFLYPAVIVLMLLTFAERWLKKRRQSYVWALALAGVVSLLYCVEKEMGAEGTAPVLLDWLPGYESGLGWILPAAAGAILGRMLPERDKKKKDGR